MKKKYRSLLFIVFSFFVVPIGFYVFLVKSGTNHYKALPIYGNKSIAPHVSGSHNTVDTLYHQIGNFTLTSHLNTPYNFETQSKDKIVITAYFFASCPEICPKLNTNLFKIVELFSPFSSVLFQSISVDSQHDSPEILKDYKAKFTDAHPNWYLLTGKKKSIYENARKYFLIQNFDNNAGHAGFFHSQFFILSDSQKRIRGFYDGLDIKEVERLVDEIKVLMKEEANIIVNQEKIVYNERKEI